MDTYNDIIEIYLLPLVSLHSCKIITIIKIDILNEFLLNSILLMH